ncbi:MAG: helix-turn-helix transcriptional regulator [Acidobacteriota bacterium]|nr:helix-turn-helix transcriptional regulator [Acidobacteriota bacterium]
MARLDESDLERVLGAVRTVGETQDPDAFARAAIDQVAALVPCDVVSFNEVDPMAGRLVFLTEPATFPLPPGTDERLAALADRHPLIHHIATTGDGSARKISDFWTDDEFHASELYRSVYEPMGVEFQMSVALPAPRPIVIGIVVNRSDGDFSERDRSVLNTLRPHLVQAWHHARERERMRSLLGAAVAAAERVGTGLLVLSEPPHELIPGTLVALYRHFGRPTYTGPLPARVERWLAAQRTRLEHQGSIELLRPLVTDSGGQRVTLRYLPAQGGEPGALLLAEQPGVPRRVSVESLGLTPREAEIVQCVLRGDTNVLIARTLGVAPATVKKHLENIYTKLGVRGRGRLAAFVTDILEA